MQLKMFTLAGAAALALTACTAKEKPTQDGTADTPAGGVTRQEAKAEPDTPPVTPMPAATVIQSQPGPDGSQVDLLSVKVTGDILTVAMRCSSPELAETMLTLMFVSLVKASNNGWISLVSR